MNLDSNIKLKRKSKGYKRIIVMLMFIVGLLNSSDYFDYMGVNTLNTFLLILSYGLLGFMCFIIILNYLYKKRGYIEYSFPYWVVLTGAVIFKFIILFIQSPSSFLPDGNNFYSFILTMGSLLLMIVLIKGIHSMSYIKVAIWSLGIGASFSAIIPLIYYPEMIGLRQGLVNGYVFSGGFWNSAVISYISIGWLLIALSIDEKSKIKKFFLISMFILIALAGLAGLSRAILVSLIISLVVYLIMSNKFTKYLKVITITSILLIVSFFIFQETIDNFGERLDIGNSIEDEGRIVIWKDYIENMSDYFVLGEIEGNYRKYSQTGSGPHTILLNWLTQYGILALIGFGVLMFGVLKAIKKISQKQSKQVAAALYAWLAAYLSVALINETGFKEFTVFAAIGIILSWGNIAGKAKNVTKDF